ncbi:MAG: hypothetical protein R3F61_37105 [Myxococcota bacterium]
MWLVLAGMAAGADDGAQARDRAVSAPHVVVLQWPDSHVDPADPVLHRAFAKQSARPFVSWGDSYDLVQDLRSPRPLLSPAEALEALDRDAPLEELEEALDGLGPLLDAERHDAALRLHGEAALREAEQDGAPTVEIAGRPVPVHLWEVVRLSWGRDLDVRLDRRVRDAARPLRAALDAGDLPLATLDLSRDGAFDPQGFAQAHRLFVDGIETVVTDAEGRVEVPPGAPHLRLERRDGPSFAVEADAWTGDVAPVDAADALGLALLKTLMRRPFECRPELSDAMRDGLDAYSEAVGDTEVYVVVPYVGRARKPVVWTWDREDATLVRLPHDGCDGA